MALSNIFREPRREITETAVGAAILLPLIYADYLFGCWYSAQQNHPDGIAVFSGMLTGLVGLIGSGAAAFLIHGVGEGVCDRLQAAGVRLRPRARPCDLRQAAQQGATRALQYKPGPIVRTAGPRSS